MTVGVIVFHCTSIVFSLEDKGVIKALFQEKGWRGKRIVQELPGKNWNRQSVNRLIDKFIKQEQLTVHKEVAAQDQGQVTLTR